MVPALFIGKSWKRPGLREEGRGRTMVQGRKYQIPTHFRWRRGRKGVLEEGVAETGESGCTWGAERRDTTTVLLPAEPSRACRFIELAADYLLSGAASPCTVSRPLIVAPTGPPQPSPCLRPLPRLSSIWHFWEDDPWGGVGCCLSAAALYLLGRSSGRDADILRSVTRVNQLKDLAALLDTARKVLPLIVTISGRRRIVEETAEQHFLKHNDAGSWIQDSALMLSMSKEVPWYLDDGLDVWRSLVRGTLDYLQGLKMLGVKRTERVLPTGNSFTVVGEAVKDDVGTVRIQRRIEDHFYVSPKDIDQLIANLESGQANTSDKFNRWYQFASMGFTVFGVFLLAKHALQYVLERRRRWELQKRVIAAAAQRQAREAEGSNGKSDKAPENAKKDHLVLDICVICLEQEYNAVFVPCGHMCCCMTCSSQLANCPSAAEESIKL
uniref:RING-type E3 ubiquitin transferase n=1 Tax=Ananas comosus var. bracteatus TaxID=296719 RepID=A0A6V7PEC1_ANACO|nr:unnamed protein product [Ananas comosus var. bracteatus]